MTRFKNQAKQNFLASIPTCSIEHPSDNLSARCKFNFSYFEHQAAGQDFSQWSREQLVAFMQKLKEFTRESLDYWTRQPVGKTGSVSPCMAVFRRGPNSSIPSMCRTRHVGRASGWIGLHGFAALSFPRRMRASSTTATHSAPTPSTSSSLMTITSSI